MDSEPIRLKITGKNDEDTSLSGNTFTNKKNLVYPSVIESASGDDVALKSYVVFYINMVEDSKFSGKYQPINDRKQVDSRYTPNKQSYFGNLVKENDASNWVKSQYEDATKAVTDSGVYKDVYNYLDAKMFGPIGEAVEGTPVQNVGDNISKGVDVLNNYTFNSPLFTSQLKRTERSITLYMPNSLQSSSAMDYVSENMGILGVLSQNVTKSPENVKAMRSAFGAAAARSVSQIISNIANVPAITASGLTGLEVGNVSALLESMTKSVQNPRKEMIFKGVDYRTFEFTFQFVPTDQSECDVVAEIIKTFRSHQHPELDPTGMWYKYPSEFDIEYMFGNDKSKYLHKIKPCALVDVGLEYGNGQNWATLINGFPTIVTMVLRFRELVPLTREDIEEGF